MPTNFDALLRYHTIDRCLQNRFRSWTWESLAEACAKAMNEAVYRPEKNTVSQRTIENDIRIMKSDLLGYNAPIKRRQGLYSYTDHQFSIRNATISRQDVANITAVLNMLKIYKGLPFFQTIESLLTRVEKQAHEQLIPEMNNIIQFEQLPESLGTELLEPITQVITAKQAVTIRYQKFGSEEQKQYCYHPYYLKEFRNRWYVIGWYEEGQYIKTFALDRIVDIVARPELAYNLREKPDGDSYFDHTIGVTFFNGPIETIILKFLPGKIPYIKSQAIHSSQQVIEEKPEYLLVSLRLCINYELESLILSFVDEVEVMAPESLKTQIIEKLEQALSNNR